MESRTRALTDALREARGRKGWSQRDVSERMKLTQAQLSRIESGASDVRLATFVELARILDLEPVLVPRSALAGVGAVLRELEAGQDARMVRGAANELMRIAKSLRVRYPSEPLPDRLEALAGDLHPIESLFQPSAARAELKDIVEDLRRRADEPARNLDGLRRGVDRLASLRNRLVHDRNPAERPAYTLDDEV
ncbi:helix-turn-helix transcriptional regulator [uncultured Caulobacter sp.]|uniref:helix-turn-helix domain-containing protein n=1 Tax=uncultured Caulobacter sp. TaxID=158749 RepID=UPI00263603C2|nr:helix-turn-helix transcriptional regulator [uncultured Caulobacter sp.]